MGLHWTRSSAPQTSADPAFSILDTSLPSLPSADVRACLSVKSWKNTDPLTVNVLLSHAVLPPTSQTSIFSASNSVSSLSSPDEPTVSKLNPPGLRARAQDP